MLDWDDFAHTLPEKPPEGADTRIPHRGMPAYIQAQLLERGYVPTDVRFVEDPETAILQTIRGATRFGTIQLATAEINAIRIAASIEGLMEKDRKRTRDETTYKDLEEILSDLATTVTSPPATAVRSKSHGESGKSKPRAKKRSAKAKVKAGAGV